MKSPSFTITNRILTELAEIAELVGRINSTRQLSASPMLRRGNRIRSVHASLAIEQNTLSLEQVTAVLDGKRILAPPREVAEVKNAFEIYERLDRLDPYSVDELLKAHGVMMRGLTPEAGEFRSGNVGVVDQDGNVLHFGTLPQYVPQLVGELLDWVRDSEVHPLIKSCVFHYELELIHPFSDGNGRVGRLWHTLLLSRWNSLFAWLPVETIIHDRQAEYYHAFNRSNQEAESTAFIEFMLSAIISSLEEAKAVSDEMSDEASDEHWMRIRAFLRTHGQIGNAEVRSLLGVSPATANRWLAAYAAEGRVQKTRDGKRWVYKIADDPAKIS